MTFYLADNGMRDDLDPAAFDRMKRRVEWIWISAEGVFQPDTPEKFQDFLINEVCGTGEICDLQVKGIKTVAFHSRGGNLAAGLKIGRMIRKLGLRTAVASTLRRGNRHSTSSGRCFSACGYAFLGGIHRRYDFFYDTDRAYWDSYGTIGVHRFKHRSALAQSIEKIEQNPMPAISEECRHRNETARVQCIDALLVQYIEDMGVDIRFFQTVTEVGHEKIEELDIKTLRELNVLTDETLINWEKRPWANTYALGASNPDPEAKVRMLHFMCMDGKPRMEVDLGPTAGADFAGKITSQGVVSDSWVFAFNETRAVVDDRSVQAMQNMLRFTFPPDAWGSVITKEFIRISAFPLHQVDYPMSRRNLVTAIVDRHDMPLMREATTHCF